MGRPVPRRSPTERLVDLDPTGQAAVLGPHDEYLAPGDRCDDPRTRPRQVGLVADQLPAGAEHVGGLQLGDARLRQRCPRCFRGRIFRGLFALNDPCPVYGELFRREEGTFLGPMYVSYGLGAVSGRIFASLPKRGDVVVFQSPRDEAVDLIKRIVGLPGDRIQMIAGHLHINGEPVPGYR